jgi:hypothetical protein
VKGFASPIAWVAQGVFFATYAEQYSLITGVEVEEANKMFASYFASIMLSGFALFFLISSILLQFTSISGVDIFIVNGGCMVASTLFMFLFLKPLTTTTKKLKPDNTLKLKNESISDRVFAVLVMSSTDVISMCIAPLTLTFGFVRIFMFVVVDEKVAANFSTETVGYMNVLYAATTAITALPMAKYFSLSTAVAVGSLSYMLLALAFAVFTPSQICESQYIWIVFVLYGLGSTSFESSTRAIYADLFPHKKAVAFAHLTLFSGMASTIASFIEANVSTTAMGVIMLVPAVFMLPGYTAALALQQTVLEKRGARDDHLQSL